jgi:hypothetical protein
VVALLGGDDAQEVQGVGKPRILRKDGMVDLRSLVEAASSVVLESGSEIGVHGACRCVTEVQV